MMVIEHLEVQNWKYFKKLTKWDFSQMELICLPNGSGKSSIFEAINYAVWGTLPVGLNLNTVRNDEERECMVSICLKSEEKTIRIKRIFGSHKNNLCELWVDEELICESKNDIFDYMNKIVKNKCIGFLWTYDLAQNDLLKGAFISEILSDLLRDPMNLVIYFKRESRMLKNKLSDLNKEMDELIKRRNSLCKDQSECDETKVESIQKELLKIQNELRGQSKNEYTENDYLAALSAKSASVKLEQSKSEFESMWQKYGKRYGIFDEYNAVKKRYRENPEDLLKEELKKPVSKFSKLNPKVLLELSLFSSEQGRCVICGGEMDHKKYENLKDELETTKNSRSDERIGKLEKDIALLNSIPQEDLNLMQEYFEFIKALDACKNWKDIIDKNDKERDLLWERLDYLSKLHKLSQDMKKNDEEIKSVSLKISETRDKQSLVEEYITNANAFYSQEIMSIASNYLSALNPRYEGICPIDGVLNVLSYNDDMILYNIPTTRLSSGEKVMCCLSLLFAIHDLLMPELPLMFDETFSPLDNENLNQVKRFLYNKSKDIQIFIITHDKSWVESEVPL